MGCNFEHCHRAHGEYLGGRLVFNFRLLDVRRAPVGHLHVELLLAAKLGLTQIFLSAEFGLTLLLLAKALVLLRDHLLTLAFCTHRQMVVVRRGI